MNVRFKLLNFAGMVCTGFIVAAEQPQTAPETTRVGPKIQFAEPFFDFGRVQSDQVVTHDFVFTNVGDQALQISDVRSSCGCAAVTNWDHEVPTGKSGTLHVVFSSGSVAGPAEKNLWVLSNDPTQPTVMLEFAATIWKLIDAIPGIAAFNFGPDFQTNETRVIRIVNNLKEPVTLSEPQCESHSFKTELKTITAGQEFELRVTVIPPLGPGGLVAPITIKSSSPQMPVIKVTAYALVQPALTVAPPKIRLAQMPLSSAEQFVVAIQNNGSNSVTLSDPAVNAKGVVTQLREVQPGRLFNLAVTFPAGFQIPDGQTIQLQVKSNNPQSPVITVPVMSVEQFFAN